MPQESGFAAEAPVALNENHLLTAFGGSINSVATLAGYAFLWLQLRDEPAHIVIGESTIRFLRPVRETIRALCIVPSAEELAAFKLALRKTGKARIELRVEVEGQGGASAAKFKAKFVAIMDAAADSGTGKSRT